MKIPHFQATFILMTVFWFLAACTTSSRSTEGSSDNLKQEIDGSSPVVAARCSHDYQTQQGSLYWNGSDVFSVKHSSQEGWVLRIEVHQTLVGGVGGPSTGVYEVPLACTPGDDRLDLAPDWGNVDILESAGNSIPYTSVLWDDSDSRGVERRQASAIGSLGLNARGELAVSLDPQLVEDLDLKRLSGTFSCSEQTSVPSGC